MQIDRQQEGNTLIHREKVRDKRTDNLYTTDWINGLQKFDAKPLQMVYT